MKQQLTISPYWEALRQDECEWARRFFQDPNHPAYQQFLTFDVSLFTTYVYPEGILERMLLANQWFIWGGLLDDMIERNISGAGTEERLQAFLTPLIALHTDPESMSDSHQNPFLSLFAQIWQHMLPLTTPFWRQRFLQHSIDWLNCYPWEAYNRAHGIIPEDGAYQAIRLRTVAAYPTFDLFEFCTGIELSSEVYESAACQLLLKHAGRALSWDNDLSSFAVEKAVGEVNNLVLIVQRDYGYTFPEAKDHIHGMIATDIRQSIQAGEQLSEQFPSQKQHLQRFITGIQSILAGAENFHQESKRYEVNNVRNYTPPLNMSH